MNLRIGKHVCWQGTCDKENTVKEIEGERERELKEEEDGGGG